MRQRNVRDEYDYVVVGAGSAGCVMAHRLSEDPDVQVLLLEAGGRNRSLFVNMPAALSIPMNRAGTNWGYVTESDPGLDNRRLDCPRGRGLGGSSAINGMVYVRGHPQDFDRWNQLIDSETHDWSYAAVLPYFRRAEGCLDDQANHRYRGHSGPLATRNGTLANPLYEKFLSACVEAGYVRSEDLNGYRQEGFGAFPMTVDDGIRCSAARAYLRPAVGRPNLHVITGALVDRVDIHDHAARKLTWLLGNKRMTTRVEREIVLCGGAIESPCILQRSGVGPAGLLQRLGITIRAELPVGENLMDHLEVYIQQACPPGMSLNRSLTPLRKAMIGMQWLTRRTGLGATNHFEAGGFVRSAPGVEWPDVQFHFLPAAMNYDGSQISPTPGYQLHVGPMLPESRGQVAINAAAVGPHPQVRFNYMSDARDVLAFRRSVELARDILRQPSLADFSGEEIKPGPSVTSDSAIDQWIRGAAQSAYHPCGTCRMGTDGSAVVDPSGQVHSISGLRVVDASLFPVITNGNLNAPTIMLAEKIAAEMTGNTLPLDAQPFHRSDDWQTTQR